MHIIDQLRSLAERVNALELRERREYHAYLQSRGDHSETLDEHIERYASLARLGPPALEHNLDRLQALCPIPFPPDLLAFYTTQPAASTGPRPHDLLGLGQRPLRI